MFSFANWTTLRTIGNSWAVKATVLIPLIGYFIIFNENIIRYLNLATEFTAGKQTSLTVQPRLLQVYFALCIISVASVVYTLVCPVIIKRYDSSATYVREEAEHLGDIVIADIEERLRTSPHSTKQYKIIRDRYDGPGIDRGESKEQAEARLNSAKNFNLAVLHTYYDLLNQSHPLARLLTLSCYVVGFFLLAIPSVQVFLRVAALLWTTFWTQGL
jgi:hypothetical protein